ncbi:MAG TPA: glycosyltransferase family 2 protein, partial [Candidatus Dormibacteraeota bacterium]|nr:glycosyltransferase family 2 protein [Candidatus Dormibacteraeota bacterium]
MSARQRGAAIVALVGAGAAGAIAGGSRRSGPGLGATGVLGLLGAWTVGRRAASALVDAAGPTSDEGRADGSQRARACGEGTGCGGAALVVLIPARDEAVVLPHVVGDLARQAHRVPDGTRGFDVVVVDDGSIDGSGEVALAAAARLGASEAVSVVRVDGGTKGAALASATAELKLAGDRLRAFVVLDADARVPPGFMCAASRLAVEHEAATVRRRTLHASADSLAATQDDEQTLDGALQALRSAGGGAPELRGNGMIVRATALDRAGGWRSGVLTEDLELSMRLVLSGTRVAWTGEAALWEDAAPTLGAFARQRMRWAEGSVRRLLEVDPRSTLAAPVPIVARL